MFRKFFVPLLAAAWAFAQLPAAGPAAADHRLLEHLPRNLVRDVMKLARDNITQARLLDGSQVSAETPAERAKTLVPFAEAELIVDSGIVSAYAEWCGEDWEPNYRHMMAYQRSRKIWSEKAMAFVGLMHGVTVGFMKRDFENAGQCPAGELRRIQDFMALGK